MKRLLENARYLAIIGVLVLLIGALVALVQGAVKIYKTTAAALLGEAKSDQTLVALLSALDDCLVATALIVISVSLYELFVGELDVPDWMLVRNLDELKAKFISVVIPVMTVKFVQKVLESTEPLETLYFGAGIALVVASLSAFNYVSEKGRKTKPDRAAENAENTGQIKQS